MGVLMTFETKYQEIKNIVEDDLLLLESEIKGLFKKKNSLSDDLFGFLTSTSKRLRPLLALLYIRCLFNSVNKKQLDALTAIELIHNATLIHDDVIDNAKTRRKKETINSKFDNNLAVIAGDLLLSMAMKKIIGVQSLDALVICTSAMESACIGEIDQYFNKFKVTSIDEYIEKSKNKTALLFEIGIICGLFLCDENTGVLIDQKLIDTSSSFAESFGIAFQIRDDLINVLNSETNLESDIIAGVYTAPIIFAYEEDKNILESQNVLQDLRLTSGIEKTKTLMNYYFDNAKTIINGFGNNIYKETITRLIELLQRSL